MRESGVVIVQKLLGGLGGLQDPVPNPTCPNGTDDFTFEIGGLPSDIGDVLVAALDHLVSGHEVPDEQKD